jgi:RHS repeat-associated protein
MVPVYTANGSLSSLDNDVDTGRSESVTYDPLNRVLSAQTAATSGQDCWGLSFGDDALGNLLSMSPSKCSGPSLSASVNGNNQINNAGFSYDAAGNMTADGQYNYSFNGANEVTGANGVNYTYDGDGLRVEKSSGTLYWRSYTGQVIEETDASGTMQRDYIFFAGRRIAWRDASGNVYYYFVDATGSTRVVTDSNGNVCFDADYYPYGQENDYNATCTPEYKFAGYEYDSETGNYYAYARYYSPRLGRFMSPDPLGGDVSNPQSLNRYAYVVNNPTNWTDPSGAAALPSYMQLMSESLSIDGLGGGIDCTADGVDTSCGTVGEMLDSGGAVECPNDVCSGFSKQGQFVTFAAGAGGASGYMTLGHVATMNDECGGVFCTSFGNALWAAANDVQDTASQIAHLAATISEMTGMPFGSVVVALVSDWTSRQVYLQGGNFNFGLSFLSQAQIGTLTSSCAGLDNCRVEGSGLHVHFVDGGVYAHLDTVNPFDSFGNFFEHGLVDLLLGNVVYTVIPRP